MPDYYQTIENSKFLLKRFWLATIIGMTGGLGGLALKKSISIVEKIGFRLPLWFAPIVGGLIVSFILRWNYDVAGNGADKFVNAMKKHNGKISLRTGIAKLLATATTLGFSGSGGVEGPILMIGGAIGNNFSQIPLIGDLFKSETKLLTICGAAGALGAIFSSPLGGGIFAVELIYQSRLHYAYLFPAVISSTMGYVAISPFTGGLPMFQIPSHLPGINELPWFILAGICGGLLALFFIHLFHIIEGFFNKINYKFLTPLIGGTLTGLVLIYKPEVAGAGLDVIQELIFSRNITLTAIVLILVAKILATSFTVGSRQSAGLVVPSLFIGALGGVIIAVTIGAENLPLGTSLIVSCMAGTLAGAANVPISAAVILCEMAGLTVAVPAAIGSMVGFAVAHSRVIYSSAKHLSEISIDF